MSTHKNEKTDIKNLAPCELESFISGLGEKPYRARQILRWLYHYGVSSFEEMSNLPLTLRHQLEEISLLDNLETERIESSPDGTQKVLFKLCDGNYIESVIIPEKKHRTICVSTQVGCAMGCVFCLSGRHGLIRNLTASEIINQFLAVRNNILDKDETVNIVFMGMGEPLANYKNTLKALHILTNPEGCNISHRRITVSTAGIVPLIQRLGEDIPVNLAISLNAATDKQRNLLMPINKTYPLNQLVEAASRAILPSRKRITFEYILIDSVNDSLDDARALASLLRRTSCKINLIPFNENEAVSFKRPPTQVIEQFRQYLASRNFTAVVRYSKGSDISAACGQLGYEKHRQNAKKHE